MASSHPVAGATSSSQKGVLTRLPKRLYLLRPTFPHPGCCTRYGLASAHSDWLDGPNRLTSLIALKRSVSTGNHWSLVARGSWIPQALRRKALGLGLRLSPTCRRQLALDRDGPRRLGGRFAFGAV